MSANLGKAATGALHQSTSSRDIGNEAALDLHLIPFLPVENHDLMGYDSLL